MSDERPWCWMEDGAEQAHGQFGTRDAAIAAALEHLSDEFDGYPIAICVGRCERPGLDYVSSAVDAGDLIDRASEGAGSDGYYDEDDIFSFRDGAKAQEALEEAVLAWAREHVCVENVWTVSDDERLWLSMDGTTTPYPYKTETTEGGAS